MISGHQPDDEPRVDHYTQKN